MEAASAPNSRAAAPVPGRGRLEEPARGAALSDVGIPRVFFFPARIRAPRRSRELAQPRRDVAFPGSSSSSHGSMRRDGAASSPSRAAPRCSPRASGVWPRRSRTSRGGESARRRRGPRSPVLLRSAGGRVGGTHHGGGSRASSEEG